jgi:hypothetical protein
MAPDEDLPFQRLWISGIMPGLNEVLDAKATFTRRTPSSKRWNGYAHMKRIWTRQIWLFIKAQRFQIPSGFGYFTFVHFERDRRRDPDNLTAGPRKLILDALKAAQLIPGDGWQYVHGLAHYWTIDKMRPGIELFVTPGRCLSPDEIRRFHHEKDEPWPPSPSLKRNNPVKHPGSSAISGRSSGLLNTSTP